MYKRIFVILGNYFPPKLNIFFYKLAGIKFNYKNIWIGNKCYIDTQFPSLIEINDNVCISSNVSLIAHFDPTMSIQNHFIKSYKKKIIIKEGVFVGPGSIILPGVIIGKNSFIRAGSVISKSVPDNSLVEGNPQKIILKLSKKNSSLINQINKRNLIN